MSLITTINGIPLFSTLTEALAWARSNNLTGYHTHAYQNKIGYMGGATHAIAVASLAAPRIQSTPSTQTTSSSSGGGY